MIEWAIEQILHVSQFRVPLQCIEILLQQLTLASWWTMFIVWSPTVTDSLSGDRFWNEKKLDGLLLPAVARSCQTEEEEKCKWLENIPPAAARTCWSEAERRRRLGNLEVQPRPAARCFSRVWGLHGSWAYTFPLLIDNNIDLVFSTKNIISKLFRCASISTS